MDVQEGILNILYTSRTWFMNSYDSPWIDIKKFNEAEI